MDKDEILQILDDTYGSRNPIDVPESDRWRLYENIKSNIKATSNPDEYTRQLILICDVLEL